MQIHISKKLLFGVALGTTLEYYDYILFSLFLPIIAPIFFPSDTPLQALMKGYIALAIAMISRPIGGLFFGYLGDNHGRRIALLGSMFGIAISTMLIGLTPAAAKIGIAAAIMVTLAKSIQLFCFGGEYNGAGIYVVEHAQGRHEGLLGSLLTSTALFGALLGSLVAAIATMPIMPNDAWRYTFIIGGFIGMLAIFYRKQLIESPDFVTTKNNQNSFILALKNYPLELLAGTFVGGFSTLPFTTVLIFINPVLATQHYFTNHQLMLLQSFLIAFAIIILLISGKIADKKTPLFVMRIGAILLVLLAYPLLKLIDTGSFVWIIVAELALILFNEILLGPSNAYLKSLFPMQYRYRASSFSFCLGMSVIGGLTPIIENHLYQKYNYFSAIAPWLVTVAAITFFALQLTKRKITDVRATD